MRFKNYIVSKGLNLCFIGMAAVLLLFFSLLQEIKMGFILFTETLLFILTALWIVIGFHIQKRRYFELKRTIGQLSEKYLLGEILSKPQDENELLYYEIMKTISSDAIQTVEQIKREKEDFELFVESWIHDIKTPLTACSLILENGGNVSKLRREIKRADNMTENILYYARLKNPEKDTIIRIVSVLEIINDALRYQMPLLIASGISAEVNGDFSVSTDDKALMFILNQLLCNTAKYCPNSHITVTAENGVIYFEDNGIGIPAHEISRVTERGFTGTNGRKITNSTGMGLFLVQQLCKHLNITMTIESEVGRYTRIILSFDFLTKL